MVYYGGHGEEGLVYLAIGAVIIGVICLILYTILFSPWSDWKVISNLEKNPGGAIGEYKLSGVDYDSIKMNLDARAGTAGIVGFFLVVLVYLNWTEDRRDWLAGPLRVDSYVNL